MKSQDIFKWLCCRGHINARDNFKWTPLHHACHAGMLDIVEMLLGYGAEIDSSALGGGTPLNRAIESSRESVVQYLIQRGARVQIENKKGNLCVYYCRVKFLINIVSMQI